MVWGLPPERAGRAPQASRHSKRVEVALGAGGREVIGSGGGPAVVLAAGAAVAAGLVGLVLADLVTDFEHALTMAAAPAPPASPSSRRRLTTSGPPSGRSGAGKSMMDTIRTPVVDHDAEVVPGARRAPRDARFSGRRFGAPRSRRECRRLVGGRCWPTTQDRLRPECTAIVAAQRSPLRHRRAVESGARHAEIDDAADQFAGGLVGIRLVYFVQPVALGDHLIEQ